MLVAFVSTAPRRMTTIVAVVSSFTVKSFLKTGQARETVNKNVRPGNERRRIALQT
jgi:hypothetical protein